MQESFSSLFGSDNPYKFFFLSGVLLLIIGLYYPFEKRQELDLKKNKVEFSDSTLVLELIKIQHEIDKLDKKSDELILVLDSLTSIRSNNSERQDIGQLINELKIESQNQFFEINLKKHELEKRVIESNFYNKEIEIYKMHLSQFKTYSYIFIIVGLILFGWGGVKWVLNYNSIQKRN